jgi:hypothetical protein
MREWFSYKLPRKGERIMAKKTAKKAKAKKSKARKSCGSRCR